MDLKSSIGICSKVEGYDKLVIIPQDPEKFNENQIIVLVTTSDFESFTDEMKALIKFVQSAQTVSEDD